MKKYHILFRSTAAVKRRGKAYCARIYCHSFHVKYQNRQLALLTHLTDKNQDLLKQFIERNRAEKVKNRAVISDNAVK